MGNQGDQLHIWDSFMFIPSALIVALAALVVSIEHTGLGQILAGSIAALFSVVAEHADELTGDFAKSLVGAIAGAWGGAFAAQKIAEKAKTRDLLLTELRNINSLTTIAFDLINAFMPLKKQFLHPMMKEFDRDLARVEQHIKGVKAGTIPASAEIYTQFDLQTFRPPTIPVQFLSTLAFEKVSLRASEILLVTTLLRTYASFCESIEERNRVIEEMRTSPAKGKFSDVEKYFGLKTKDGHSDLRYRSALEGCSHELDDLLFYADVLCASSMRHGDVLKAAIGKHAPAIVKFKLRDEVKELMPDPKGYPDWT